MSVSVAAAVAVAAAAMLKGSVSWQSSADTCQTVSQPDSQTVRVVVTVVTVSNIHSYTHTHTLTLELHTPSRHFERLEVN